MAQEIKRNTRRYVRIHGPFDGYHLGMPKTPVLIYDLNLGGGLVNFTGQQPAAAELVLRIDLPQEGRITVNAEALYRDTFGVAVRFIDLDQDTSARLVRTVDALKEEGGQRHF
jgi:hypothetical protein